MMRQLDECSSLATTRRCFKQYSPTFSQSCVHGIQAKDITGFEFLLVEAHST